MGLPSHPSLPARPNLPARTPLPARPALSAHPFLPTRPSFPSFPTQKSKVATPTQPETQVSVTVKMDVDAGSEPEEGEIVESIENAMHEIVLKKELDRESTPDLDLDHDMLHVSRVDDTKNDTKNDNIDIDNNKTDNATTTDVSNNRSPSPPRVPLYDPRNVDPRDMPAAIPDFWKHMTAPPSRKDMAYTPSPTRPLAPPLSSSELPFFKKRLHFNKLPADELALLAEKRRAAAPPPNKLESRRRLTASPAEEKAAMARLKPLKHSNTPMPRKEATTSTAINKHRGVKTGVKTKFKAEVCHRPKKHRMAESDDSDKHDKKAVSDKKIDNKDNTMFKFNRDKDKADDPMVAVLFGQKPKASVSSKKRTDKANVNNNANSDASTVDNTPTVPLLDSPDLLPLSPLFSPISSLCSSRAASPAPDVYELFENDTRYPMHLDEDMVMPPRKFKTHPLFAEDEDNTKKDVPLMTTAKRSVIMSSSSSSQQAVDSASCMVRHPHRLDKCAFFGDDHLLVHLRAPHPKKPGAYAPRKPFPLGTPRGTVSTEHCPWAQPLDRAFEDGMVAVGTRKSTRETSSNKRGRARAHRKTKTRSEEEKEIVCQTELTLFQNAGKTYLSYHAVSVTYEDVRVLRNGWLTDNNITFWEEYLEREVLPKYPQARIALLRASFTMIVMADNNVEQARKALPDFRSTTHIFLPISDATDLSRSESGTHWSLLLVSIIDGVAFHYDSMGTSNLREARNVTARMAVILGRPLRFRHIDDTPQQDNGVDCGVFVCVLMRFLLVKRLLNAHAREKVSMSLGGKMIDAQGGRKEMLRIIENLRREGQRRRSESPFVSERKSDVPRIE
ncbi:hypothetical protein SBRCBS47491_000883 [Sporothrix bragantina]|uniref:Ubiquitin-like protease family profile domain-containing protein n=1 Tax=Sporothrix bragantina TaxID=671064 RepID=A0ABP0AU15_9PEZI